MTAPQWIYVALAVWVLYGSSVRHGEMRPAAQFNFWGDFRGWVVTTAFLWWGGFFG